MQASQLALDSYLTSIQADINQLAGTLPDILQRLEDKLDVLAEREGAGGLQTQQAQQQPAHISARRVSGKLHSLPPGQSRSDADELESESDGPTQNGKRQEIERKAGHLPQAPQQRLKRTGSAAVPDKMEGSGSERLKNGKTVSIPVVKSDSDPPDCGLGRVESSKGAEISSEPKPPNDATGWSNSYKLMDSELGTTLKSLENMLVQITNSIGIKNDTEGDDDADRKRLKEKLKLAIEADRRSRIRPIVSRGEVWIEYIFGICQPDQRIGKRGSRLHYAATAPSMQHCATATNDVC